MTASREQYDSLVADAVIRFGDLVVSAQPGETKRQKRRREKAEAKARKKEDRTRQACTFVWTAFCENPNLTKSEAINVVKAGFAVGPALMFLEPLLYPFLKMIAVWAWNRLVNRQ